MGFFTHLRAPKPDTGSAAPGDAPPEPAVVASSTLVTRKQITSSTARQDWMTQVWRAFDQIGEVRYVANWKANAAGRSSLTIGHVADDTTGEPTPADDPPELAQTLLDELHGGRTGQTGMMQRLMLHLTCVGESYLIGLEPDPEQGRGARRRWLVASNEEFANNRGKPRVQLPDTGEMVDLDPDRSLIIRIWKPHARVAWHADSAMRPALPSALNEIEHLTDYIHNTLRSRLAGPGILAIPNEASMPAPSQSDSDGTNALHGDDLVEAVQDAFVAAIRDQKDVSALAPIMLQLPKDTIGSITHIPLDHQLSDRAIEMRQDAIRRFAGMMDVPGEILLGMSGNTSGGGANNAGASHWSAWQISTEAIQLHIEPLLGCICDALTQNYLWPSLQAAGVADYEQWVIWYDATALHQQPDRSTEAQALYDKGALSLDALLRENGFDPDDAPGEKERTRQLARDLLLTDPNLVRTEIATLVGLPEIEAAPAEPAPTAAESERVDQNGNTLPGGGGDDQRRALDNTSRPNPPDPRSNTTSSATDPSSVTLLAVAEQATLRVLEKAGKHLFSRAGRSLRGQHEVRGSHSAVAYADTPAWELHTIASASGATSDQLDKMLTGSCDTLRATLGHMPNVEYALDLYWRTLLTRGQRHETDYLRRILTQATHPEGAAA